MWFRFLVRWHFYIEFTPWMIVYFLSWWDFIHMWYLLVLSRNLWLSLNLKSIAIELQLAQSCTKPLKWSATTDVIALAKHMQTLCWHIHNRVHFDYIFFIIDILAISYTYTTCENGWQDMVWLDDMLRGCMSHKLVFYENSPLYTYHILFPCVELLIGVTGAE